MKDDFSRLFELMDRWRHLPKYKFEGNLQPYFGLFLKDILCCKPLEYEVCETVIPEFPLKKKNNNQSKNVDFLALATNKQTAYLVELKTDMGSISDDQIEYLKEAKNATNAKLVCDLIRIAWHTDRIYRKKYAHLFRTLADKDLQVVNNVSSLHNIALKAKHCDDPNVKGSQTREWRKKLEDVKPDLNLTEIKVIFVLPKLSEEVQQKLCKAGFWYITFENQDLNRILRERGEIGTKFAEYLGRWKDPAGSQSPV